jgi:hypothetical protein
MEIQASPLAPYFFQSAKCLRSMCFKVGQFSTFKFVAVVVNRECALPFFAPVASWSEPNAWAIQTALPRRRKLMRSTEVHYPFAFTMSGFHRFGFVGSAATVGTVSRSGQDAVEPIPEDMVILLL